MNDHKISKKKKQKSKSKIKIKVVLLPTIDPEAYNLDGIKNKFLPLDYQD